MNNDEMKEIGKRLQLVRETHGFSQREVVNSLKIGIEDFKQIEKGNCIITVPLLKQLCDLYFIDEGWVLYGIL